MALLSISWQIKTNNDQISRENSYWRCCGSGFSPDLLLVHDPLDCSAFFGLGTERKQTDLSKEHPLTEEPTPVAPMTALALGAEGKDQRDP